MRAVCETEPQPPSEAVRTLAPDASPPGASAAELRGDLDTILLKALRKEPARRYPSVQELSEDLRRYLEGRAVHARKDTVGYRVSKFVGRHRAGVAADVLAVAGLVAGTNRRHSRGWRGPEEEGARPLKVARVSAGFIGVEDGIHPSHIWTLVPRVGAAPAP